MSEGTFPPDETVSGAVQILDSAGTNKASVSSGGAVKVDASNSLIQVQIQDKSNASWLAAVDSTGRVSANVSGAVTAYGLSGAATLQNAVSATGDGTTFSPTAPTTILFEVTGTFSATVNFEGSTPSSAWAALPVLPLGTNTIIHNGQVTTTGLYVANANTMSSFRARVTWTSGTSVTVKAFSLTAGNAPFMVVDGSGVTQPVSGTVTANAGTNLNTSALALETGGNLATVAGAVSSAKMQTNVAQVAGTTVATGAGNTNTGTQRVVIASDQSTIPVTPAAPPSGTYTLQNAVSASGNGVTAGVDGFSTVVFAITGTFTATYTFQASFDNATTWQTINAVDITSGGGLMTSAGDSATNKQWIADIAGATNVRAPVTWTSGTSITITARPTLTPLLLHSLAQNANTAYIGGTAVDTNSGTKSAGTQRVVLATDQPALTNALKVDGSGVTQPISVLGIATPTLTNVSSSATSVTLLSSNANRRQYVITNDSTQVLYVKYGTTASATSYTYSLQPGQIYESLIPCYTGQIDGVWAAANGNARVTETTT